MRRRAGARRERDAIRLAAALQAAACPFRLQSPNGQAYADNPEPTDLRRVHRRIRRRRRHGRQGAHRGRRGRRDARSRADVGSRRRLEDVRRGRTTRRGAAPRPRRGRSASSTPASAAGTIDGEPYTQRAGHAVRLVPRAHARRPHQPLGPHLAALRARRLPAARASTASATTGRSRYDDIKPYYDKVDRLVGIFGIDGRAAERAGRHLPAAAEAALLRAADQAGGRQAEHHRASRRGCRSSRSRCNGRPACHYCGQCGRGCATHSNFSSPSVLLPPALATGKLTHHHQRDGARGHRRTRAGSPTGVSYIDKNDRPRQRTSARAIVVLAASACESARLLLNSKSSQFPHGLAQLERRRRQVPHRLDRHWRRRVHPEDDGQRAAQRGRRRRHAPLHAVVARQQEARFPARLSHRARRRPTHAGAGLRRHSWAASSDVQRRRRLRQVSSRTTTAASTARRWLRRPRRDDPERGHATARSIRTSSTLRHPGAALPLRSGRDHEINQAKHMQETFRAIIHEMGGTPLSPMPTREQRLRPRSRAAASSTRSA